MVSVFGMGVLSMIFFMTKVALTVSAALLDFIALDFIALDFMALDFIALAFIAFIALAFIAFIAFGCDLEFPDFFAAFIAVAFDFMTLDPAARRTWLAVRFRVPAWRVIDDAAAARRRFMAFMDILPRREELVRDSFRRERPRARP